MTWSKAALGAGIAAVGALAARDLTQKKLALKRNWDRHLGGRHDRRAGRTTFP